MANEKRLIWGDIAENQLMKLADYYKGSFSGDAFERAAQAIAELPTVDAVEVVRCKDCISGKGSTHKACPLYKQGLMKDDDYCSVGERRTDAN